MRAGHLGRTSAALLSTTAVLALIASGAGPAEAEGTARITQVTSENGSLRLVLGATGLEPGTSIDPETVRASVDDNELDTTAERPTGSSESTERTAVLVIDTSRSMENGGLNGAKDAANKFLDGIPDDVRVGLVTFASTAQVAVAPTTDHEAVRSASMALSAGGNTALYDATELGVTTVGTSGVRSILLLSDGNDSDSSTTLAEATAAVEGSGALLDAVSLGTEKSQVATLRTLTDAGDGVLLATDDTAELARAFEAQAESISTQVVATAALPSSLNGKSGTVTVTAEAGGQQLSDEVFVSFGEVPADTSTGPRPVESSSSNGSTLVLVLGIVAVFGGLAVLLVMALSTATDRDPSRNRVRRRLSVYTLSGRNAVSEPETSNALGDSNVARSAVEFAGRVVERTDLDSTLTTRLDAAAVPLRPAEWSIIHLGVTLGAGLLGLLLSGGSILVTVIALVAGAVLPWTYLARRARRRRAAFLDGLPDTLQLIAGGLSAGHALPQAVDAVVREVGAPIGPEFNRALVEARLGVPLEDALESIGERMGSTDFAWTVMAMRIQREVGGNLAEILTTVAATLRERARLRRQVDVLSAEGKLSAAILGGLPVVFITYLVLVRPGYLEPMYTEPLGWLMTFVALVFYAVGIVWLRQAVKVEV
jgi:tight adherence protein B